MTTTPVPKPYAPPEREMIVQTKTPHVYYSIPLDAFLFADETSDLNNGEYPTRAAAAEALRVYASHL